MPSSLAASRRMVRLSRWWSRRYVQNIATLGLVALGPILAASTYAFLGPLDRSSSSAELQLIFVLDIVYILVIASLVLNRVIKMISARRRNSAGSQLHLRLTGVFTVLALLPTVFVAIFAVLSINLGLEGWFSERVRSVVNTSFSTALAYEFEHKNNLSRDALAVARALNNERRVTPFMNDGEVRAALIEAQNQVDRVVIELFVIDGVGNIVARGDRSYLFGYEKPNAQNFEGARTQGIVIVEDANNNEFRALVPLSAFLDRYLYISRLVDGQVLDLLDDTRETSRLYNQLERERGARFFQFGLLYFGFALILILAAIWLGLWFSERLSAPIGRLVFASQKVGRGDLSVRVLEAGGDDELALLGRNFNQMTAQLQGQREELLDINKNTEEQRRLFDSVLSSVTSGVMGVDPRGRVTFINRSAQRLLKSDLPSQNNDLSVCVPEFYDVFLRMQDENADTKPGDVPREVSAQLDVMRSGQQEILLVRMSPWQSQTGALEGYVIAFDDITGLVSAQRMAAWGDVARRIAHEIKNPLTPIQLSAERIHRKFTPMVGDSADKLQHMTNVIVRQTNDLRRIVDEFSKFARMPEPSLGRQDLVELLQNAVTLQQAALDDINFELVLSAPSCYVNIDDTMISQALTNLIKNAGEAIVFAQEKGLANTPRIVVNLSIEQDMAVVSICDNGLGWPDNRARLFEPYVTTRDKGTGLGLPIVKKIVEEHGGRLSLLDATLLRLDMEPGAMVEVRLPIVSQDSLDPQRVGGHKTDDFGIDNAGPIGRDS